MRRILCTIAVFLPAAASAAGFDRPIPQPQSATAEWWFFAASLALLGALLAVFLLVRRR